MRIRKLSDTPKYILLIGITVLLFTITGLLTSKVKYLNNEGHEVSKEFYEQYSDFYILKKKTFNYSIASIVGASAIIILTIFFWKEEDTD